MASIELTNQCQQAIALLEEIQAAAMETKEYEADWLGSGKTINRQGGRFAPKNGGGSSVDTNNPAYKEGQKEGRWGSTKQSLKEMELTINQLEKALKGLTEEERLRLDDFSNNPNTKKINNLIAQGISDVNPEMGEYYKKTNDAILGGLKNNRTITDTLKKAKLHLQDIGKIIGEHPAEYAIAGTIISAATILGGIGAVALFSIPNLIGLGGVFGGITSIAQGAAAAEIVEAFAIGGLSQLGFSVSAYAVLNGAYAILYNINMLEQVRFQEIVSPMVRKTVMELDQKMAWQEKEDKKKPK